MKLYIHYKGVDIGLLDTVIASSLGKEVHNPQTCYLHAALLHQAFTYCGKFPTTASCRSLGRVSFPVWLIILSNQLLVIALVSYCLTNQLTREHWVFNRVDCEIPHWSERATKLYIPYKGVDTGRSTLGHMGLDCEIPRIRYYKRCGNLSLTNTL